MLAATFAALGILPILFLAQIAFIVAFGVLLDTFVVRSLLVPALCYDIGPAVWWPSRLWHTPDHADRATAEMLHLGQPTKCEG
ncbi:MAG TPA: MMPL family transporter [Nocardioidaceae bacterium]|nr:MMPL family transporter [Nocardioidaceae bacterium]